MKSLFIRFSIIAFFVLIVFLSVGCDQDTVIDWISVGEPGTPSFQNSWVNDTTGDYEACRFGRDGMNYGYITGRVSGGSDASVIFTLPENYRPSTESSFIVTGNSSYATVSVQIDGDVYVTLETNAGSSNWIDFGDLRFICE